jgi:hypothetical protein
MRMVRVLAGVLSCTFPLLAQSQGSPPAQNGAAAPLPMQMTNRRALPRSFQQHRPSSVPSTREVPPEAAVVTLEGVCDGPHSAAKPAHCKTVITRAELDSLVDALMPEASQNVRSQFAINYVRILAAAEVARRRHLEENAAVAKEIRTQERMARMRVLASSLYKVFEAQAQKIPLSEIQDYYSSHAADYEAGEVQRLSLPKSAATESGQPVDLAAAKTVAESMRARAAAGEDDLTQLQQDAYKKLGIQSVPPPVAQTLVRRKNLPPDQAKVFDQKVGEISEVVDAPGALIVLKLVSKKSIPLQEARPEIESTLQRQHLQQNLHDAAQSVKADFNLKYFDMTSSPDLFPAPGTPGAGPLVNRPRMMSNIRPRGFAQPGFPTTPLQPQP